jgi:large subunit ribosomal protein L30
MAKLKVIQVKSGIGRPRRQRDTLKGLGLTKMHQERLLDDTPSIRGMINKISHLVECQEVEE